MESYGRQDRIDVKFIVPADEDLVAAAKLWDQAAFAELWTRHSSTAFNMAYRITGNRDDAEDVVQDAWMKAYSHLNMFDGRAKFSTWLSRIAINSALMFLRKKRARPETSMENTDGDTWQQWEIADQTKNTEELYAKHEATLRLRRAVCRLQPALRNVIEIHQSNDCSVKETAELDMAYGVAGLGRFRVNVFQQRGNVGMVLRVIPTKIRTTDELNLPAVINRIC